MRLFICFMILLFVRCGQSLQSKETIKEEQTAVIESIVPPNEQVQESICFEVQGKKAKLDCADRCLFL